MLVNKSPLVIKSLMLVLRVRVYRGRGVGVAVASEVCRAPTGGEARHDHRSPGHGGSEICPPLPPHPFPSPSWPQQAGVLVFRLIGFTDVHSGDHRRVFINMWPIF